MSRSAYLSGRLTGVPGATEAFASAAAVLRAEGWSVMSPPEHPLSGACLAESREWIAGGGDYRRAPLYQQLMREFTRYIAQCSRFFAMESWERSGGACYEAMVARACGVEVWSYDEDSDRRRLLEPEVLLAIDPDGLRLRDAMWPDPRMGVHLYFPASG